MMKSKVINILLFIMPFYLVAEEYTTTEVPIGVEMTGQVNRYDEESGAFEPIQVGEKISVPTLYFTATESELIVSYPAKIVARFGENTRVVVSPEEDGRYEVDLHHRGQRNLLRSHRI